MSAQREARSELICPAARVSTDTLSTRSHLLSVAVAPSTCFSRDRAPVPRLVSLSTPPGNSLHLEIYSRLSQLNGNHSQLYCSLNTAGDSRFRRFRERFREHTRTGMQQHCRQQCLCLQVSISSEGSRRTGPASGEGKNKKKEGGLREAPYHRSRGCRSRRATLSWWPGRWQLARGLWARRCPAAIPPATRRRGRNDRSRLRRRTSWSRQAPRRTRRRCPRSRSAVQTASNSPPTEGVAV